MASSTTGSKMLCLKTGGGLFLTLAAALALIANYIPFAVSGDHLSGDPPSVEEVEDPAPEEAADAEIAALDTIPVPLPDDLDTYVSDKHAAIKLGKALFWDMQVGSDGKVACASCHWSAGADAGTRSTLYPGVPGSAFGPQRPGQEELERLADDRFHAIGRPNSVIVAGDFPTHRVKFPTREGGYDNPGIHDTPEVVGSQGVQEIIFDGIVEGSPVDDGTRVDDPEYHIEGVPVRQQTTRNTPTMINAVFNDRQFWDGRAQRIFNGVNPFGDLDPDARVLRRKFSNTFDDQLAVIFQKYPFAVPFEHVFRRFKFIVHWFLPVGFKGIESLEPVRIRIEKASLASQAVGPPLSDAEMSWIGRTFPELGRKMFSLDPLALQEVHPEDSVLGNCVNPHGKGLKGVSYADLVREAFRKRWWSGNGLTNDGFTHMEANFSLFWGLSVMLYESTLVSDDSPFDRHDRGEEELSEAALRGLEIFVGDGKCANCHGGPELTSATVGQIRGDDSPEDGPIEFMEMQIGPEAFYDNGFYNIGVRPTLEDIGVGADHPEFGPLSFTRRRQLGRDVGQDIDVPQSTRVAVDGAFKVPTLRNIELTGPYMHNGGMRTLTEVVQFYVRRADFFEENIDDLDPDVDGIAALQENPQAINDLVEFLKSLTDERVRFEKAPFDHPELVIVNGHNVKNGVAFDIDIVLPAVGRDGGDEVLAFDEIVPGDSPTSVPRRTLVEDVFPNDDHDHGDEDDLDADAQKLLEILVRELDQPILVN